MDQETHDAAVYKALSTVLVAWRDAWSQGCDGKPDGLLFIARLERALSRLHNDQLHGAAPHLSTPAKPEAKLELMPTTGQIASAVADEIDRRRVAQEWVGHTTRISNIRLECAGGKTLAEIAADKEPSTPAKPEAKLEALPTMEDWGCIGTITYHPAIQGDRFRAFYDGLRAGKVKIVDERGKGAEAERLAPCPVNGCGKTPTLYYALDAAGCSVPRYACYVSAGLHVTTSGCATVEDARAIWNAAFQRAERFPGER